MALHKYVYYYYDYFLPSVAYDPDFLRDDKN